MDTIHIIVGEKLHSMATLKGVYRVFGFWSKNTGDSGQEWEIYKGRYTVVCRRLETDAATLIKWFEFREQQLEAISVVGKSGRLKNYFVVEETATAKWLSLAISMPEIFSWGCTFLSWGLIPCCQPSIIIVDMIEICILSEEYSGYIQLIKLVSIHSSWVVELHRKKSKVHSEI